MIMLFVFEQSKSFVFCAAIQFLDRMLDIPVVPQKGDSTVQFLSWLLTLVVHDSCPWLRQCSCVHRQGRRHPWFKTVEVPQIQSSTELNDDFEAGLAHFSDSSRKMLSPGVRGFFEPSTMKSSSLSRLPGGGGVAGSLTPR